LKNSVRPGGICGAHHDELFCEIGSGGSNLAYEFPFSELQIEASTTQSWHFDAVRLTSTQGRGTHLYSLGGIDISHRNRQSIDLTALLRSLEGEAVRSRARSCRLRIAHHLLLSGHPAQEQIACQAHFSPFSSWPGIRTADTRIFSPPPGALSVTQDHPKQPFRRNLLLGR